MADRVIQRNDTTARWQSINPVLATGEIGIEIDGAKGYKIGDGKTRWNDLPYPANPTNVVQELGNNENAVPSQKLVTEKLSELGSKVGTLLSESGGTAYQNYDYPLKKGVTYRIFNTSESGFLNARARNSLGVSIETICDGLQAGDNTTYTANGDYPIFGLVFSNGIGTFTIVEDNSVNCNLFLQDILLKKDSNTIKELSRTIEEHSNELNNIDVNLNAVTNITWYKNAVKGCGRIKELYLSGLDTSHTYQIKYLRYYVNGTYEVAQIHIYDTTTNSMIANYEGKKTTGVIKLTTTNSIIAYAVIGINTTDTTNVVVDIDPIVASNLDFAPSIKQELNKRLVLSVDKNGNGDYAKIRDAVSEAIKFNGSIVKIGKGIYDLLEEFAEEIAAMTSSSTQQGICLENDVHLIFESGAKVVANYTGGDIYVETNFSPFYGGANGGFVLENLDITAKNTRYCVHDDNQASPHTRVNRYINCKFDFDNTTATRKWYGQCIGGGSSKDLYVEIRGCYFKSKWAETEVTPLVSYHNTISFNDAMTHIFVSNCYFADKGTFRITHYGETTEKSIAYMSSCSLGSNPVIAHEGASTGPENFELVAWSNEIRG